jgi:hypothetical protein
VAELPTDLQKKITQWQENARNAQQTPADVAASLQAVTQLLTTTSALLGQNDARTEKLATLLEGMVQRTDKAMGALQPVAIPDSSKPIVAALNEMKTALLQVSNKPQPALELPTLPTPQVTVEAPAVDLEAITVAVRELAPAFRDAVGDIHIPEHSTASLEDLLERVLTKLDDIDTGVRLKPQAPNTLKVTNPDGSPIGSTTATNTVNQGTGAAAGTSWRVIGDMLEITGTVSSTGGVNQDVIPATDVSAYAEISLQLTGTWVGTLTFQGSNDGVNFTTVLQESTSTGSGTQVNTTASNGIFRVPRKFRYFRARMTAFTSGTVVATAECYTLGTGSTSGVQASQTGTWNVGHSSARVTIQASAAQTTSGSSAAVTTVGPYASALVTLNCSVFSGTTPTLNVKIQASDDAGTTWYDIPNATFTQLTTNGSQAIQISNFGDTIRAAWTIAGTTPSFTFAVKAVVGA